MTPDNGKIYAVGDIHGCYGKLGDLLARLSYQAGRDRLVFLGDYINRGPDSAKVVERLVAMKKEDPGVITLMGNHEYLLLEYHRSGDPALLPYVRNMGIEATLASYGVQGNPNLQSLGFLPPTHLAFLEDLQPYWESEQYIFVHAGLTPGLPLAENDLPTLCEARESFISTPYDFGKKIIFSHTPMELPLVTPNKIGIDTGAVYGNLLTAVELPGENFHHA